MIKKYIFGIFMILSANGFSQSNYAVTTIPFQQYTASSALQGTMDDHCSELIPLPFNFDFYGTSYNQVVISTNGYIDFRTTSANGFSPFAFSQTIPNVGFPVKNSILGAYTDLNNSNAEGTITYGVYGTAPYRKFVVYFYNNSFFSCTTMKSTFQMILHETSNIIDVQLVDKQACPSWNSGRTVTGLINLAGDQGIAAPGRNTGSWTAFHEGWRFSRPGYYVNYPYTICDDDTDGFGSFDLTVVQNDLASINPALYEDAALTIPITNLTSYVNTSNPQTIYAAGLGIVKNVVLSVIDCGVDYDNDTVSTSSEDINLDTNLANDDSDADGIPNYLDNDDDGDLVLTNVEYVFNRTNGQSVNSILDTDSDGIPNYLDNDDDGDGVLTFQEDYNGDGNPANDDTNGNSIPDYLEQGVALGVASNELQDSISIYPNPASDVLFFENNSTESISNIEIYTINGSLVKNVSDTNIQSVSVSDLQTGIYFLKIKSNNQTLNYKFIKN
jgi:hypothetical protein